MNWKGWLALIWVIIVFILPHITREQEKGRSRPPQNAFERGLNEQIDSALAGSEEVISQADEQAGHVEVLGVSRWLTEADLAALLSREDRKDLQQVHFWSTGKLKSVTASALGLDHLHHFANSYLVGFKPFDTTEPWVPLYAISMRKSYQYDNLQYSGLADVWQNSRQAFASLRGDCEDHALLLADWLIGLGYDARVAIGTYKGQGHAWVVLVKDGQEFLLEATDKSRLKSYPLALTMTDYRPKYQFNREQFWTNTAGALTVNYTGGHWQERSRFVKH